MKTKMLSALLGLMILALVLVGCGGDPVDHETTLGPVR